MKKALLVLTLCVLFLFSTGCSSTEESNDVIFSSQQEMLAYLQGIWVIDCDEGNNVYFYIFQGERIFTTNHAKYGGGVMETLSKIREQSGFYTMCNQTFEDVTNKMSLEDCCYEVTPDMWIPEAGLLYARSDRNSDDAITRDTITVTRDSASVESNALGHSGTMYKISDTAREFPAEYFESTFNEFAATYIKAAENQ